MVDFLPAAAIAKLDETVDANETDIALAFVAWDGVGRLAVDDSRRLLWANESGRHILEQTAVIEVVNAVLVLPANDDHEAFCQLLADAQCGAVHVLGLHRTTAILVQRQGSIALRGTIAHCLTIACASADPERLRYPDFRIMFGLTRAEDRTLSGLLSGSPVEEVAANHGVSIETVRTHVRRIYTKLGVRSREALFHKVGAYRM